MEEFNKSKDTEKFHLLITRDLQTAKNWVKKKSRVNQRYGLFMNTKGLRLQAEGLVNRGQQGFDAIAWWLDPKEYVDSSVHGISNASDESTYSLGSNHHAIASKPC
jgi:hypothetical protein